MPPRPFPYPLRVGVDICSVSRVRAIISRPYNGSRRSPLQRFLSRILTRPECRYFWERFGTADDVSEKFDAVSQFLAGRFAAKEACRKACDHLDTNSRGLHHIVILPVVLPAHNSKNSSPPQGLILDSLLQDQQKTEDSDGGRDPAENTLSESWDLHHINGQLCEISISHDGGFATAVAIVPSMKPGSVFKDSDVCIKQQESTLFASISNFDTVPAAAESMIDRLLTKRSEDLQRRSAILDKIMQLQIEEQGISQREQTILGTSTPEERRRLEKMLGVIDKL
ncbi:hypothetical protein P153DRAFT_389998 [Dothidotthia symphoricarpi CBS 119687]|uniref:4'-phosphopantetheinyl transferase domain-containing protein n=1 Tax=Dothidotthia symphoricarpi CBS 119687 TaxID=1392245 RepID=A0A6A6A031_9PLEO|nr:uncharacterized protein P153DRAFT_389998 [Dothidotthia symphoricarpi CBS 119687]KAF2125150.1 hypothetical protein P153DRAFT_389998 [Dothidotthia symphoricarpi CBS 119687]